jgi:hypothetical protein
MMGGAKAHHDGIAALSQTDFTKDLKKSGVKVRVMHSADDQVGPYANDADVLDLIARRSRRLSRTYLGTVPDSALIVDCSATNCGATTGAWVPGAYDT